MNQADSRSQGAPPRSLWAQYRRFLRQHPVWWLAPLIVYAVLELAARLASASLLAPDIYTLF